MEYVDLFFSRNESVWRFLLVDGLKVRDLIVLLQAQGWQRAPAQDPVSYLVTDFAVDAPLEARHAICVLKDETSYACLQKAFLQHWMEF